VDDKRKTLFLDDNEEMKKKRKSAVNEYKFTEVFDIGSTNQDIYERLIDDLVTKAFNGDKCSFFVYGQTGSGKTYTISGTKYDEGVFQISIKNILERQQLDHSAVTISAFEIYKEQVFDLLTSEEVMKDPLKVTEKKENGSFEIEGLSKHKMSSWSDFRNTITCAESRRHFANTYLNHSSSRSHFGVRINIVSKDLKREGLLTFLDLAGCEKINSYKDSSDSNIGDNFSPVKVTR
jgi:hypothetical protein